MITTLKNKIIPNTINILKYSTKEQKVQEKLVDKIRHSLAFIKITLELYYRYYYIIKREIKLLLLQKYCKNITI